MKPAPRLFFGILLAAVFVFAGLLGYFRQHNQPPALPLPVPPVPSPLAVWPWPRAIQDTPHLGVTHWLDTSSPDGTMLDFFDFDLGKNPHLRFEIYDQDEDDAHPFDDFADCWPHGVGWAVQHLNASGRGKVVAAWHGLFFNCDPAPGKSQNPKALYVGRHVTPVVLNGKVHCSVGQARWTFGVQYDHQNRPAFKTLLLPDKAALEKNFTFAAGGAQCLILDGHAQKLLSFASAQVPFAHHPTACAPDEAGYIPDVDWIQTSRATVGWSRDQKHFYLLFVKQTGTEGGGGDGVAWAWPAGGRLDRVRRAAVLDGAREHLGRDQQRRRRCRPANVCPAGWELLPPAAHQRRVLSAAADRSADVSKRPRRRNTLVFSRAGHGIELVTCVILPIPQPAFRKRIWRFFLRINVCLSIIRYSVYSTVICQARDETKPPMLVQFSVENFLSFDEEQVFSMVAASGDQHPAHLVPDVPRKGESLLRTAALYGANGAGKSNLVKAMQFAKTLIVEGTRSSQPIAVHSFKLGKSENRSSKFEFIFSIQNVLYNYGFRLNTSRILEEWLFATPKTKEVLYFQRSVLPSGSDHFEFGSTITGRMKRQQQFLEFVSQGTRPNQLFLTEALERNVAELKPVMEWFQRDFFILSAETPATHLEMDMHENKSMLSFLETILRNTGTGIEGVTTEEIHYDFEKLPAEVSNAARKRIEAQLLTSDAVSINFYGPQEERLILKRGVQNIIAQVMLRMLHRGKQGEAVKFDMSEESDGTRRLINLAPALFMLRQNPNQVVVLDELDRRLHPFLSRFFVQAALHCDEEPCQSQLIFTTHDTNLLDLDLLRRDEIWFVEKDKGGASHFYSLAEFKTRPDLKIEKGYLNGRFGAIPFIGDIERLQQSVPEKQESVPENLAPKPELAGATA